MIKIYILNFIYHETYDGLAAIYLCYLENITRVKTRVKLIFNDSKTAKYRAKTTARENA
jgi:hypothetical protein